MDMQRDKLFRLNSTVDALIGAALFFLRLSLLIESPSVFCRP
jgi:hypothetical protein